MLCAVADETPEKLNGPLQVLLLAPHEVGSPGVSPYVTVPFRLIVPSEGSSLWAMDMAGINRSNQRNRMG